MKLDRKAIIIIISLFLVLALVVAIPAAFSDSSTYNKYLNDARKYSENNLCVLAIESYENALSEKDSLDVELELCEAYSRGVKNGEITNMYNVSSHFKNLISKYHNKHEVYDAALSFYLDREDYQSAAETLLEAEKTDVSSDVISKTKEVLKTKYNTQYSLLLEVKRSAQETYVVKDSSSYYAYDENFKQIFNQGYDYLSTYINGYALAKKGDYTFLLDSKGIRQAYFDNGISSSTGVGSDLIACEINKTYSYFNLKGEKIFGEYEFAGRFKDEVAAVKTASGWKVIDTEGNPINDEEYEDIKLGGSDECCSGGVIFAKKSGKYYMYDKKMTRISDSSFDDCDVFLNDTWLAAVKIKDKWGFIDSTGKIIIDAKYDAAKSFSNGLANVNLGKECFFIDVNDEKTIAGDFTEGDYFNKNGLCLVKHETFWQPITRYYVEK